MADITGMVLRDRYQIERLLGRGGMADVYLAFDMHRQTHVALKLIREDLADDADFIRRFGREAAALARLDHPNVVRFYSTEQDGPLSFIVMDYVPGSTLQRRLAQAGGPLPLAEVTSLLHQIGPALHYAHSLGFIHRDIKPGNIMLREDGTALLSDFGAARVAESATLASLTIGTPAYMSPEQILGRELQAQSDLYSFGLVLYEMLAGRRPFTGDEDGLTGTGTISRLREAHLRLVPPDPRLVNPAIPPMLSNVILKTLEKDVANRWPSVVDLMDSWDAAIGSTGRRGKAGAVAPALTSPLAATVAVPAGHAAGGTGPGPLVVPASSQSAPSTGPISESQPLLAAQTPTGSMSQPVQAAPPRKGSRGPWLVAGVAAALLMLAVVAWQFIVPALATSRTASQPDLGATAAVVEAVSRDATATANVEAQVALQQTTQRLATAEARSTASAVTMSETATAANQVIAQAASLAATATTQAIAAEAAATAERARADAVAATDQASQYAQGTATAAAQPKSAATAQPVTQVQPKATAQPYQPAAPGAVVNFEYATVWQIGDQPYGSLQRSTEQVHGGSASGRLSYDFPAVQDSFVVFRARPAIALAGQPAGLTAWVYGDGSGHFLNTWIQDSTGQVRQYTFGRVTHQGWQQMTALFDDTLGWPNVHISGPDKGKIGYPASMWGLVLDAAPHGEASSGVIYVDDIETVSQSSQ